MNSFQRITGASAGIFWILRPAVSIYPAFTGVESSSFTLAMMMFTIFDLARTLSNLL